MSSAPSWNLLRLANRSEANVGGLAVLAPARSPDEATRRLRRCDRGGAGAHLRHERTTDLTWTDTGRLWARRLSPDRGSRRDRGPAHRRPCRDGRDDRLVLPAPLRLTERVRRDSGSGTGRLLPHRPCRAWPEEQAALPSGHKRSHHAVSKYGRGGGDPGLHAGTARCRAWRPAAHPPGRRRPRRDALPPRARAALRLRPGRARGLPRLGGRRVPITKRVVGAREQAG